MLEPIALFILISSVLGMVVIIFRKIPVLVSLPDVSIVKEGLISQIGKRIKEIPLVKNFSYELFLQKILKKIRILILKIENFTFHLLQKLRESHRKKNASRSDDYWKKIRQDIKKIKK